MGLPGRMDSRHHERAFTHSSRPFIYPLSQLVLPASHNSAQLHTLLLNLVRNIDGTPPAMSPTPIYRVERYFQPHPNFATSTFLPPKYAAETLIETHNLDKAQTVLKDAGVFTKQENAWKIFIADAKGGWEKRVEDEEKVGMWVYKVFLQENEGAWKQYTGDCSKNTAQPNNAADDTD